MQPQYVARPFGAHDDFATVLRFTARMVVQQTPYHICLPGDLAWWRSATPDDSALAHLMLWYRGEALVGWSWRNDTHVDITIDSSQPRLWDAVVAYYASTYREIALWAYDHQPQRNAILQSYGFVATAESLNLNIIATHTVPHYVVPAGWHVETLRIADTLSRVVAQRSAFQSTKMTLERYDFVRQHPAYTPAWDMVAKNHHGDVDAFCTVWVDTWSGIALFEPVGCRQAHHRKGITRGLLCETLRRLAHAGIQYASVMSDGHAGNPAQYLYQSCGFQWVDKLRMWQRAGK